MSGATLSTSGPAHRVQSAVEMYGFPKGHLGHLTGPEVEGLREFKALVIKEGLFKPDGGSEEYGTHDDATLLRFLRARRFNVQDAFVQFKDTEDWRTTNQLDTLYETIDVDQYDETRRLYPQWTGRRDRRGIPVYVFEVKHLNAKTMSAYEKSATKTHSKAKTDGKTSQKLIRLFALYENLVRFVMPLSTALADREHPRTPITQSNNIVDISGVGLKQFWNLRAHMQDASTLATAHYPETLDRIFIIGAPAFFPTVWGWIKRWFDPITTSKIFILGSHEMKNTLEMFIDPANIPIKYGGQLDFEFGNPPVFDPVLNDQLEWKGDYKEFPHGPMYWRDKGDHIELTAVGSVNKVERFETVATLKKQVATYTLDDELEAVLQINEKEIGDSEFSQNPDISSNGLITLDNAVKGMSSDADNHTTNETQQQDPVLDLKAVEAGEIVPASRPEPVSFITANEGLSNLTLKDSTAAPNGVVGSPHVTKTANLLDSNVNPVGPTETTVQH